MRQQVDGIFIVPRKLDPRLLGEGRVGFRQNSVRDGANAGWISYMLKDRQKSEFDGFLDCIIIDLCIIQLLTRRRSLES